jgi:hypothetical protein
MFVDAVGKCTELNGALQNGLRALGNYSTRVVPGNPHLCEGSVDLDGHLLHLYPSENRWDYALGYSERTYFVEVHPATTSQVGVILAKLAWLRGWLREKAQDLNAEPKSFHWVPSGNNTILKDSRQARQCAQQGIKIDRTIHLP